MLVSATFFSHLPQFPQNNIAGNDLRKLSIHAMSDCSNFYRTKLFLSLAVSFDRSPLGK